ncbi:endolytic transglycosylase MltG [Kozakia baliensis]|uniref:endolytic transglycosylase MltG n=1 Tax=Kozakia baliensis TaxID=153496 RepID=UPI00345B9CB6
MRKLWLLFAVLVLALAVSVGGGWWLYERPGPLTAGRNQLVPRGGTLIVAHALGDAGILHTDTLDLWVFQAAVKLTRQEGPLRASEFAFPAHVSIHDVLTILRHAPPVEHRLTIPEGWTARRIAALLEEAPTLSGLLPPLQEGNLLPQTVSFLLNTPRATIAARLEKMMDRTLASVWENRDPTVPLPDPHALLVLASIVERETGIPAERAEIARVFLNRLKLGMRLQSDPTTIYDLSQGWGELSRPLTHADLAETGPNNTYVIAGLPPQPICSPGRASLEAVAHPAPGDALYFVATGTGGHSFAASLSEHNKNVSAYRAARSGMIH